MKLLRLVYMYMCVINWYLVNSNHEVPGQIGGCLSSILNFKQIYLYFSCYSDWCTVCNVKSAKIWHYSYTLTNTKEAYKLTFNSQNI